ncbi:MAG: hypothetical protein JEZ11_12665 [Desulfobacterales bacterium]|nr:hypothetical protein [Desulfobacterales bacterium]
MEKQNPYQLQITMSQIQILNKFRNVASTANGAGKFSHRPDIAERQKTDGKNCSAVRFAQGVSGFSNWMEGGVQKRLARGTRRGFSHDEVQNASGDK